MGLVSFRWLSDNSGDAEHNSQFDEREGNFPSEGLSQSQVDRVPAWFLGVFVVIEAGA